MVFIIGYIVVMAIGYVTGYGWLYELLSGLWVAGLVLTLMENMDWNIRDRQ